MIFALRNKLLDNAVIYNSMVNGLIALTTRGIIFMSTVCLVTGIGKLMPSIEKLSRITSCLADFFLMQYSDFDRVRSPSKNILCSHSLIRNWCWQIISWLHYPEASATSPTWLIWVWERTCCNTFLRRLVNAHFINYFTYINDVLRAAKKLFDCSLLHTLLQQPPSVIVGNQNWSWDASLWVNLILNLGDELKWNFGHLGCLSKNTILTFGP